MYAHAALLLRTFSSFGSLALAKVVRYRLCVTLEFILVLHNLLLLAFSKAAIAKSVYR
jgi:hypothetical protein